MSHIESATPCTVLMTAAEAYPAFERAVLHAHTEIVAGFRVFDFTTKLRSKDARQIGSDWFDLLAHVLNRGVKIKIILSDFDPVVGADMHRLCWMSMRQAMALQEVIKTPHNLSVDCHRHPARIGRLNAALLWPLSRKRIVDVVAGFGASETTSHRTFSEVYPGLAPFVTKAATGEAKVRLWPPVPLHPVTHHQKIAVIDRRHVYMGGLDQNDRRYDTLTHDQESRETWHDVQILLDDPELATVAQDHLQSFRSVTEARKPPSQRRTAFLRTLSAKHDRDLLSMSPDLRVQEIFDAHCDAAKTAENLIYLETQFFRDPAFARVLARAGRSNPALNLILVLPAAPEDIAFQNSAGLDARYGEFLQNKCLSVLQRAFGDRLCLASPVQQRHADETGRQTASSSPIIYVHSKVSVFDGAQAIIGSANLNGRSFRWDSEAAFHLRDRTTVRHLLNRCYAHWWPDENVDAMLNADHPAQIWRRLILANAARPPTRRSGFLVPYPKARAKRFGVRLPFVPAEMV